MITLSGHLSSSFSQAVLRSFRVIQEVLRSLQQSLETVLRISKQSFAPSRGLDFHRLQTVLRSFKNRSPQQSFHRSPLLSHSLSLSLSLYIYIYHSLCLSLSLSLSFLFSQSSLSPSLSVLLSLLSFSLTILLGTLSLLSVSLLSSPLYYLSLSAISLFFPSILEKLLPSLRNSFLPSSLLTLSI